MLTGAVDKIIESFADLYEIGRLIGNAFRDGVMTLRRGLRPVLSVYLRQVYFTGLEALKIVVVTSLIIGTVVITQIISIAGMGSEYLIGKVMVWVVVKEFGPLLTAIIVIARSGAAIAAELSQMKIGGEIEYLESLGIPAAHYLVMPRIMGVTTAVLILAVYSAIVAVLGGYLVAAAGWRVPFDQYFNGVFAVLTIGTLFAALTKGVLFGLSIAAACCHQGLKVGRSVTQIPQAATKAVMQSLFLVFVLDGIVSVIFLL
jgi:phospholipid/cholesterol/gamma-HCH transport system permease protein